MAEFREISSEGGGVLRAASQWTAGFVGGVVAAVRARRARRVERRRQRWLEQWRRAMLRAAEELERAPGNAEAAMAPLRQSLLGMEKGKIAGLLGSPSSAYFNEPVTGSAVGAYWHADVWYYPLDVRRRLAVAIHFADGRVADVERLSGPEP